MGVPKFYRWISERYPCLSEVIKEYQIPEFDNLYLDMNGIIHVCSHPNDDDPHFRITEEKIFADICHYIDFLFKMIQPKKVFFMAVDGVAPRAKMNQQRGRRFRTARSAVLSEQKAKESGQTLPEDARFDSNCITPGTSFMSRLHEILKNFVSYKISTDKLWQNLRVYLSGHETPGEGEHKVMDFIRYEKSQNNYDPNTRHCLYGLDADLIMLGLCSHEPHFSLLREEVRFGRKENQKRIVTPEETTFHLLHLSLLREYLGHEFHPVREHINFEFDLEKIIDDFVLMSFLVGNDFIPHLPQLHIHHDALPVLYKTYIEVLPSLGGYINEMGFLNLERFELFFEKLAEFDYEKFGEMSNFPPPGNKLKDGVDSNSLKNEGFGKLKDLGFSELSLSKTNEYDDSSEDDSDEALFILEFNQHKMDYYHNKIECDVDQNTEDMLREQAEGYVRAIQWNLHYYYNGIASWSWFYPHHYAPYISDVRNFKNMEMNFEMGTPFTPFQQLLGVLPVLSKDLLPKPYQDFMCDDDSPLKDCYPEDFETDLNGKQLEWEAVVLIPFINESLLLKCSREADKKLSAEEKQRNKHGPHLLYGYSKISTGSQASFLPGYFPSLHEDHSKCELLDKDYFRLHPRDIKKGLCESVLLDVHFPGFPTLKHVSHTSRLSNEEVKVFQMVSRRENMMLTITEHADENIVSVAKAVLGKTIHVGWPHLQEGFIEGVSTQEISYVWEGGRSQKKPTNADIWHSQAESVAVHYHSRFGIFVGEINILVHAKCFRGSKFVCNSSGKVVEEKQWTESANNFPLQAVVEDLTVHCPKTRKRRKCKDLFPEGATVFMLGQPHYGCMGVISDNNLETNKGHVIVDLELHHQPDLAPIIRNKNKLITQKYMPGYIMAQKLGISSHMVSRITGTYLIQMNSKESISPNRINVGLNLKFNRKNEEVSGFTKRTDDNQWLYSGQALETLNKYLSKFPEFIERLMMFTEQDITYLEDMYPEGDGKEVIQQVSIWVKSQQCSLAERQACGLNSLDDGVVVAIEDLVSHSVAENSISSEKIAVKPELLYNPLLCKGCIIPDQSAAFCLFDRVINARHTLTVPLGLHGTVVAIREADRICDYIYEVVFDKEFFGGMKLHCTSNKGYRMPPSSLINISHGNRLTSARSPKKHSAADPCSVQDKHISGRSARSTNPSSRNKNYKNTVIFTNSHISNENHLATCQTSPIQVLKKTGVQQSSSNQPFYKTDAAAISGKINSGNFAAQSNAPSISSTPDFVMPIATPSSHRSSFGAPKNSALQTPPNSDYGNVWNDLMKRPVVDTSPVKQQSGDGTLAKPVEELFRSLGGLQKVNDQPLRPPPPSKVLPPPRPADIHQRRSTSMLMNRCKEIFNNFPKTECQQIAMTKWYIASITLPNGQKFPSPQFPSEVEATEYAAELALATLGRVVPTDVYYGAPKPTYSLGLPLPAVPPYMPRYTCNVPVMRYPNIQTAVIPESFVEHNQMLLTGQVPIDRFIALPNANAMVGYRDFPHLPHQLLPKSNSGQNQSTSEGARATDAKEAMFVPLQVLKNTTKKQTDESTSSMLLDQEWPSLPRKGHMSYKHDSSNSNSCIQQTESGVLNQKQEVNENCSSELSFKAAAEMIQKPKFSRKQRLAANFSNMPE